MDRKEGRVHEQPSNKKVREFSVGDLAVYPAHGVGRINAIETKVVGGETHDFYIMQILENGMKIMIPTWNVEQVGLRDIIDEKDIPKIYEIIKNNKKKAAPNLKPGIEDTGNIWTKLKPVHYMMLPKYSETFPY
jgi:CarD family transcriptional regulator